MRFLNSVHHWWPNSNVGKRRERDRADSDPLCQFPSQMCLIHKCLFFSSPEKAQRRNCSNGQVDRIHEWVTWNLFLFFNLKLFFSLGFKWKTTKSCKKNPFLCDYLSLSSILVITEVYFTYIILMWQYALLEIHLVWGWTLCWNCYPKYGVLFGGLCWGLGPTVIPIWILRGLVKAGSRFMCRYPIGRRKNDLSLLNLSGVLQNLNIRQFKNGVFDVEVAGNDSGLEWISGIML